MVYVRMQGMKSPLQRLVWLMKNKRGLGYLGRLEQVTKA